MIKNMTFYEKVKSTELKLEQNVQLDSCPFCGGEAVAKYSKACYGLTGVKIFCTKCHISTMAEIIGAGIMFCDDGVHKITESEALNKAAAKWNRRTEVTA